MLCGLTGKSVINSDRLISDRAWKLMTISERNEFVKKRHVYVVDDSVITGAAVRNVYLTIDNLRNRAKSRNVVFLTSEYSYDYTSMFQSYKDFDVVTVDQRREQNEKIMLALYRLAIPFIAGSPSYHSQVLKSEFEDLKRNAGVGKDMTTPCEKRWEYIETPLVFGGEDSIANAGFFQAPKNVEKFGSNILHRGVRVCVREFLDENKNYIDLSLVPWVMFDAIDYDKATNYLLERIQDSLANYKDTWLYRQLMDGEPARVRTIVHRVITYIYECCVFEEFKGVFADRLKFYRYVLPNDNNELEKYHFGVKLYDELRELTEGIKVDHNCPAKHLRMCDEEHNELSAAMCKVAYHQMEVPSVIKSAEELEDILCKQREVLIDVSTHKVILPTSKKRHPIVCYREKQPYTVLTLIRRAIASLHSEVISYRARTYLLNTLLPGEGSPLAFVKNYDFIYALHSFSRSGAYSRCKEKLFAEKWKDKSTTDKSLSQLSETMIKLLLDENRPGLNWPTLEVIIKAYGLDPHNVIGDEKGAVHLSSIDRIVNEIIAEVDQNDNTGIDTEMDVLFQQLYN